MKLSTLLILGMVVAFAGMLAAVQWGTAQKQEKDRLGANQDAFLEKEREYKLRDSLNAVSIGVLTLRSKEFTKHFSEIKELVHDMGIRMNRIENITQSSVQSGYRITAPVRDTVIAFTNAVTGVSDTSQLVKGMALTYKDPWIKLEGTIFDSKFNGSVVTYDTITQVVHRIPKRFLFFRFGTKELRQEIVSSNPNSRITYSRSLKIEK